jgi:hypothetical protein
VKTTVNVKRDATPPTVRGSADRGPDANGWYTREIKIEFSGSDALSGVSGCSSSASYSGPDSGAARISGTCTDGAGNAGSTNYEVKYDATPPTVAAKAERQPDANGWYNHAVKVAFLGTDTVSGVDTCVPPVEYKGPDTQKAALSGTCRDKAGHTSAPASLELKYDTKPPALQRVNAELKSTGVVLRWKASADSLAFAVVRRPGLHGPKPSTVYKGPKRAFTDQRLQNGVKYRYTVTAYDQAGNGAAKVLLAQPRSLTKSVRSQPAIATPALKRPAADARLQAPPLLTWGSVPKATYYNVQLYRDGAKILTVWPKTPKFRLQQSWRYDGRTFRLTPGRYRWYVWPGFGLLNASSYGKLVGTRQFVVTHA